MSKIEEVIDELKEYTRERDWEKFHSPKNLSMALSVEASELLEIFQWLSEEESYLRHDSDKKQAAIDELADIFVYTLLLAEKFDTNLIEAAKSKISKNKIKYPAEKVRGSAKKYTEY